MCRQILKLLNMCRNKKKNKRLRITGLEIHIHFEQELILDEYDDLHFPRQLFKTQHDNNSNNYNHLHWQSLVVS